MTMYTVDVYAYSSDNIIRDPHASGIIVKATQGTYYVSSTCNHQYALAKSLGKKRGLYHYAGGGNPVAEAQFFVNNIKNYVGDAILILDWESYQNPAWGNTNWARQFVDEVHRLTGVWCLIYVQESALWQVANCANTCGAWVAKYPYDQNGWNVPNMHVSSGAFASLIGWQFTGNDMDRSIFYIDGDTWNKFANPNAVPEKVLSRGYLDSLKFDGNKFTVSGWFAFDKAKGKQYPYVILTSEGKELARQAVQLADRPDVAKAYPDIPNAAKSGFAATFDYTQAMVGKKVQIIFRYTDDPAGNGNFVDWSAERDFSAGAAYLDRTSKIQAYSNTLSVSLWFASDKSYSLTKRFLILFDVDAKKEVRRIKADPVDRPDVAKAYPQIYGADRSGFAGNFKYDEGLVGKKLQVIARYSDADNGEGNYVDYWFPAFEGPAMPVIDGKIENIVRVHSFSAKQTDDKLIELTFK